MSKVVRSSKYRNVFGTPPKVEECYNDLKVTRSTWDSNFVSASPLFIGIIWEAGGGGAFAVLPWKQTGKNTTPSLVTGHKGAVLDIEFNPFNDNIIASASEDCYAKIWRIPDEGLTKNMEDAVQILSGHKRKVGQVRFNPIANNVLATTSADYSVKTWDIEKGACTFSLDDKHAELIQSCDWNFTGTHIVTSCKDKKIRVADIRGNSVVQEVEGHQQAKASRAIYLGNKEKIFSTGFSKNQEREYAIWDPRDMSKALVRVQVDSAAGLLMPFYDNDTGVLLLAGKGDGNIRLYEIVEDAPYCHYLTEYKTSKAQRGLCMIPKRAVNVSDCEIIRVLKVHANMVEPIPLQVPRKGTDIFQEDIFPPCFSGEPSISSSEWVGGKSAEPKTTSLEGGFVKKATVEFNPVKVEEKQMSEKELKAEVDKLKDRVAYLEAELIKRDHKLKELENK